MTDFTLLTDVNRLEALRYFRDPKRYLGFELPPYFEFEQVLLSAAATMQGKQLKDVCKTQNNKQVWPADYPDVNHVILSNKDGGFAWRPLQIIHPILYIDLVNTITSNKNWKSIRDFFEKREKSCVKCISLPLISDGNESDKAVTVSNWWDKIEQESLRLALDYKFMFMTDISNCYPSIYTHSLEWALHPLQRKGVKADRASGKSTHNLGTEIDIKLRNMNQGQTTGIPQGSELMNLTAEIVLGGTDLELSEAIANNLEPDAEFKILRYRDDYRIFCNEYITGHQIMKLLNEVLYLWNMKMNSAKTLESSDIVSSAIKPEKMEEIYTSPRALGYQKAAMRIYQLSKKYPNSGLVAKNLTYYFDILERRKAKQSLNIDYEVIIAILTMTAHYSPKYMPQIAAIISKIIEISGDKIQRKNIINRIVQRFTDLPNTEFIDIWLQRISSSHEVLEYEFKSNITRVAVGVLDNESLWNSEWLRPEHKETMRIIGISSLKLDIEDHVFSPVVSREEFELYKVNYD